MFRTLPKTLLSSIAAFALASCASPTPTLNTFEHFNEQYDEIIARDLGEMKTKLEAGEITQADYNSQLAKFEEDRVERVNELVFHNHQLKENDLKRHGIPVPGFTPATSSGQHGGGFGSGHANGRGFGGAGFGSGGSIGGGFGGGGGFGNFGRSNTTRIR